MLDKNNKNIQEIIKFTQRKFNDNNLTINAITFLDSLELNINSDIFESTYQISRILYYELNLNESSIVANILYFGLKNSKIDLNQIYKKFGIEIANILDGLERINNFPVKRYEENVENFIKLALSVSSDFRTIFIKIAEQTYLMRNLENFEQAEKENIAIQNQHIYSQFAHRLGLYNIKTEMEEMTMKFFNYNVYKDIANKLDATKKQREDYIVDFIKPLKVLMTKNRIDCEIKGRSKAISSIWSKMKRQDVGFEKVYDTFAIRVVIDCPKHLEKSQCWQAYSLITDKYKPNPKRLRDWISAPKTNGYESLHTTVFGHDGNWVEVQIRTKRMDEIAEQGHAAHWKYKEYSNEKNDTDIYSQIRSSLEKPVDIEVEEKTDKTIKSELYTNEIFVFTPKGDIIKLNEKDTVLDLAFTIHSILGSKCIGAIVNSKQVSYKEVLKNGDTVEIRTSTTQKPTREWLRIAKNPRARTKIRRLLKDLEFKWAAIGKERVQQKFKNLDIEFTDQNLRKVEKYFDCKTSFELFEGFGTEKFDLMKIKKALEDDVQKEIPTPIIKEVTENDLTVKTKGDKYLYIDNKLDGFDFSFAKCCNPIPGDEIIGFISIGAGAKIHRRSCKNAVHSMEKYPYRIVEARWSKDIDDKFEKPVTIMITGINKDGIANSITNVISNELKLKMRSINIQAMPQNYFKGFIAVVVKDKNQLNNVMQRLQKIKDVINVGRIK